MKVKRTSKKVENIVNKIKKFGKENRVDIRGKWNQETGHHVVRFDLWDNNGQYLFVYHPGDEIYYYLGENYSPALQFTQSGYIYRQWAGRLPVPRPNPQPNPEETWGQYQLRKPKVC